MWWIAGVLGFLVVVIFIRLSLANERINALEARATDAEMKLIDKASYDSVHCQARFASAEIASLAEAIGYELRTTGREWVKKAARK